MKGLFSICVSLKSDDNAEHPDNVLRCPVVLVVCEEFDIASAVIEPKVCFYYYYYYYYLLLLYVLSASFGKFVVGKW